MEQEMDNKQSLLLIAITEAAKAEAQFSERAKTRKPIDKNRQKRTEDIIQIDLPERFGKLMSSLDLQKQFVALGLHVRGFGEAAKILSHLAPLMAERLETGTLADLKLMDDLIALCDEMKEVIATR